MSAEVPRLFVFARHAESTANTAHAFSSDPARPVALTEQGRAQARALGAQLANVHIDLAVGTRFQRSQETIGIALHGRRVPVLIEPGFDELRAGDLDGAPIEAYRSWRRQHTLSDRLPHGESPDDAFRRYANALRSLLARTEPVTLVVLHESALRNIALAAGAGGSRLTAGDVGNAVPFLFDEPAAGRAATSLDAMAASVQPSQLAQPGLPGQGVSERCGRRVRAGPGRGRTRPPRPGGACRASGTGCGRGS
jgi:broad specificity phosphatase PhoE